MGGAGRAGAPGPFPLRAEVAQLSVVAYVPGNSFLHNLDPRAKLISLVVLTITVFATTNMVAICVLLGCLVVVWLAAGLPARELAAYFKVLGGLMIFLLAMQAVFYPGRVPLVKPLLPEWLPLVGGRGQITVDGLWFGVVLSARLVTLVLLLPLVTMTTPVDRLTLGMVKLGLPYRLAYTITTAINMIPLLQAELAVIRDAQTLRAYRTFEKGRLSDKVKAYLPLIVPLLIGAMRRAQMMGVAADSRAFGASRRRTYVEDIQLQPRDYLVTALVVAGAVASLVLG